MSIHEEMGREDVVHIYSGILVVKKNEIMPSAATRMDLEMVILSEVSQTEKDKHPMILPICGILKRWYKQTYLQIRNSHRCRKQFPVTQQ